MLTRLGVFVYAGLAVIMPVMSRRWARQVARAVAAESGGVET